MEQLGWLVSLSLVLGLTTLAQNVERSRGRGDKRGRSIADGLPQPRAVRREARELAVRVQAFAASYSLEHEQLATLGSAGLHVQAMPELTPVEAAVDDQQQQAARDRCRDAVKLLRRAASNVEEALRAFGPLAEQPTEPSPYAVISRHDFYSAVAQNEHEKREEELRRG